jgi:SAM-dependent methyltransferase
MADPYWNHNTRYFPWVLDAVPSGCGLAVDVGCGDGLLTSRLATRARRVVGLDASVDMARVSADNLRTVPNARAEHADFLRWPAADGSVDFVSAVASLHHMDLEAALMRISRLLAPGGVLAAVGLARERGPVDLLHGAARLPVVKLLDWRYRSQGLAGGPDAPLRDPELTWSETRQTFARVLPGVRFRRGLAWRYTVYWRRPN